MLKKYVGKNRAENLDWLTNVWLKTGPPVCFLQGFSGVGKTDLARDFREQAEKQGSWQHTVINEIADRATPSVLESLMELSIVLSQQRMPEMEQVLFEQASPNLSYALEKALRSPVVIILDEAQRFFRTDSGAPLPEMQGILGYLRNRPDLPGRLLLLSDRVVEEARWSEWIPKRTLAKLEPAEAVEVLEMRLNESGLDDEIPAERKKEVVRDLDFNPRAIEALVGALRYDTLDEIIESNPGLWTVRDREISRDFLKALERDLLERTMRHLDETHRRKLWRLAAHRRSFRREALEKLCGTKEEAAELRSVFVTRFLLNLYKGALSLNPIVREISLAHLRDDPAEFRQAHSAAADYHLRHFTARQMVGTHSKLAGSFAELRYHLAQSGRLGELQKLGSRFTEHLKQEIKSASSVPTDPGELDERIGVLTVLLEGGGAKGLEYHLARCLQTRGKPDDIDQAIVHAERALAPTAYESWYLLATLTQQARGAGAAVAVIRRGIKVVPPEKGLSSLYQLGAQVLAGSGKADEAVALLGEGIKVVPPEKGLFSLYQLGAQVLAADGKAGEAVALLMESIKIIPPENNLYTLYQSCASLLAESGKSGEAVALLMEGIKVVPPDQNLFSLYQLGAQILVSSGKSGEAVALLGEGIKVIPPEKGLFSLYQFGAEMLASSGKVDEAVVLLREGIKVVPPEKGLFSLYQKLGEVFCRAGNSVSAIASLREGIQRIPEKFGRYKLVEGTLYLCAASGDLVKMAEILSAPGRDAVGRQEVALGAVLQQQARGDWRGAAETASLAGQEFPRYLDLAALEAFSRLGAHDAEAAWRALSRFPTLRFEAGEPHCWLASFIHLRRGAQPEASAMLERYLNRPVDESRELNEPFLLRLWDEQETQVESNQLCFHLPIMPAALTGLGYDVRRVQFSRPVLPAQVTSNNAGVAASAAARREARPEVYVSYAWGEDKTEEGRRREEIVDRLCQAIRASGREIGRDRERVGGGDSIERFAQEISKAERIVAVISEKSLHSDFCMAQELFRAYRRCDYQRSEFQEKVIALVMDDAEPLLKDNLARVALARHWRQKFETLREQLTDVDPDRRSHDLWLFVNLLEEMVPRLPNMLDALGDIVMRRGFDEIVGDNFREVIGRLPPKAGA